MATPDLPPLHMHPQQALLDQVKNITSDQLAALAPAQREQMLFLQQQVRNGTFPLG